MLVLSKVAFGKIALGEAGSMRLYFDGSHSFSNVDTFIRVLFLYRIGLNGVKTKNVTEYADKS